MLTELLLAISEMYEVKSGTSVVKSSLAVDYSAIFLRQSTEITDVTSYLAISGLGPATNLDRLKTENFTAVVACLSGVNTKIYEDSGIDHMVIAVEDRPESNLQPHFQAVCNLIEKHRQLGGKTLVFCAQGISRSATLVLAYLISCKNLSLLDAFNFLRKRRCVCPNVGFFRQLISLEREKHAGVQTVEIIKPVATDGSLEVADVVWNSWCSGED